jgi:esterase
MHPQLFFREFGSGPPLIILHGLFGSSDNWLSISRTLSDHYHVITVDLRNHGQSFHHPSHRYPDLAGDVADLIHHLNLDQVVVVGHSMGGKVAMQLAHDFPELISRQVVVDIFPMAYPSHHDLIFKGLNAVPLDTIVKRSDADSDMSKWISEPSLRQFLLKSLKVEPGKNRWAFNLKDLISEYDAILAAPSFFHPILTPTVFIMGENSEYLNDVGDERRKQWLPESTVEIVPNAGHWVHAENPQRVVELITQ